MHLPSHKSCCICIHIPCTKCISYYRTVVIYCFFNCLFLCLYSPYFVRIIVYWQTILSSLIAAIGRTYENKRARNLNPPSCARTKKRFTDEKRLDSERWLHYLNKDKSHIHHTHTHIFTKSTYRIFFTYFFFYFFLHGKYTKTPI